MAYMCIYANRECDGCGLCSESRLIPCPHCGSKDYTKKIMRDDTWIGCNECVWEEDIYD